VANLKGPPWSVINEATQLIRKFGSKIGEYPVVLEIGCNDGMHTRIFLNEIPGITMHCFEPDRRPLNRFDAAIGDDPRVVFYPVAVAEKTGKYPWFQSGGTTKTSWLEDWDLSSSIRRPTGHLQMSAWVTFTKVGDINAVSLDDWNSQNHSFRPIDLIFMDVQGAEADVILGGKKTLANTRYLYSEYYDTPMYEGQKSLKQLMELLGPDWELEEVFKSDFFARNKAAIGGG